VKEDERPVVVNRPKGRLLSECIVLAEARGSTVTLDDGFARDVEEGIESRRQTWTPPSWD